MERSTDSDPAEVRVDQKQSSLVRDRSRREEANQAPDLRDDSAAIDIDIDTDMSVSGHQSEGFDTKDPNRTRSCSDDSLTIYDEIVDLDSASSTLDDAEAQRTSSARKRKLSETNSNDRDDNFTLSQDLSAVCDSPPKVYTAPRRSSLTFPADNGTSGLSKNPDAAAAGHSTYQPPASPNYLPARLTFSKANEQTGIKPSSKYLTDEQGQTWRYVGMQRGSHGRMRRRYARQKTCEWSQDMRLLEGE